MHSLWFTLLSVYESEAPTAHLRLNAHIALNQNARLQYFQAVVQESSASCFRVPLIILSSQTSASLYQKKKDGPYESTDSMFCKWVRVTGTPLLVKDVAVQVFVHKFNWNNFKKWQRFKVVSVNGVAVSPCQTLVETQAMFSCYATTAAACVRAGKCSHSFPTLNIFPLQLKVTTSDCPAWL